MRDAFQLTFYSLQIQCCTAKFDFTEINLKCAYKKIMNTKNVAVKQHLPTPFLIEKNGCEKNLSVSVSESAQLLIGQNTTIEQRQYYLRLNDVNLLNNPQACKGWDLSLTSNHDCYFIKHWDKCSLVRHECMRANHHSQNKSHKLLHADHLALCGTNSEVTKFHYRLAEADVK